MRLLSRNDLDRTSRFAVVADALASAVDSDIVLDGEVVAFDGRRTSFERLQKHHPRFQGLRQDKDAREVVREQR